MLSYTSQIMNDRRKEIFAYSLVCVLYVHSGQTHEWKPEGGMCCPQLSLSALSL